MRQPNLKLMHHWPTPQTTRRPSSLPPDHSTGNLALLRAVERQSTDEANVKISKQADDNSRRRLKDYIIFQ
tara:strand:- start:969 stop:1181 length:213 start_codon:yes stop_codon:yes gene_type:complete